MVLLHSEKGERLFKESESLIRYCNEDVEKAIELDGIMAIQCPSPNPEREQFFRDVNSMPFDKLMDRYFPFSYKKSIVQFVKPFMHKMGILNKMKRIMGK